MQSSTLASSVIICALILVGCDRTQDDADTGGLQRAEVAAVEAKIETLVAESTHDPSTDSSRVRTVCTFCGAWNESDLNQVLGGLFDSAQEQPSQQEKRTEEAATKPPFSIRHLEQCGPKGGMVKAVYPDEPGWARLDSEKREQ